MKDNQDYSSGSRAGRKGQHTAGKENTCQEPLQKAHQSDEDVRRIAEEQRALVENSPDIIARYNRKLERVYINRAVEKEMGIPMEGLIGRHIAQGGMPDHVVAVLQRKILDCFETGMPQENQMEISTPKGKKHFQARFVPEFDVNGRVEYVLNVTRNITNLVDTRKALAESEERHRALLENINDVVFEVDNQGIIRYVSPVSQRVLERLPESLVGRTFAEFVHPDDIKSLNHSFQKSLGGKPESIEFRVTAGSGQWRYVRSSSRLKYFEDRIVGLVGALSDVTEKKEAEKALQDSEQRFRMLAENALDLVFRLEVRPRLRFVYVSPSAESITGYAPCDFYRSMDLLKKIFKESSRSLLLDKLTDRQMMKRAVELQFKHRSGMAVWVEVVMNPVDDEQGKIAAIEGMARDITERKKAEEEIRRLTFYDALTGLYNRTFYEQELKRVDVSRQLPLSVIIGDLNGLKLINDSLGHQEGDRILQLAADILRMSCRQEDIVCRWGGDEFAILLPKTDEKTVEKICQRIEQNGFLVSKNADIPISMSLGASTKHTLETPIETILKDAEDRMYRNKLLDGRSIRSSIIASLLESLENKTRETREHTGRLRQDSMVLGAAMELSSHEMDKLSLLCAMHDIGKIAVPDHVLAKKGVLTEDERHQVQHHSEYGYRIAQSAPDLSHISHEILGHHEWWDGSGYPQGLKEDQIPFLARVLSVVDAYDVMTHGRPYRPKVSQRKAAEELVRMAGSQFDPDIVALFVRTVLGCADLEREILCKKQV